MDSRKIVNSVAKPSKNRKNPNDKMHKYTIKEIYYTLQGEGAHTGRPAVFLRFSGCNLWSGREEDRDKAICKFCDTDFRGTDGVRGGKYTASEVAEIILELWPDNSDVHPYVVCTGGEPLLQLDEALVMALPISFSHRYSSGLVVFSASATNSPISP